jgi:PAS domain-containing protein
MLATAWARSIHQRDFNAFANLHSLAAAVEQAPQAIVITDAETRILHVNEAFTRITVYLPDDAIGNKPLFMGPASSPPPFGKICGVRFALEKPGEGKSPASARTEAPTPRA